MNELASDHWAPQTAMVDFYEAQLVEHPTASLVGFKWKPYTSHPAYDEVWRWLSARDVHVLYQTRNPLYRAISTAKNGQNPELKPHCNVGDDQCLAQHAAARLTLHNITATIEKYYTEQAQALVKLEAFGIQYARFTYEGLFVRQEEERLAEWRRMLRFLLPARADLAELSAAQLDAAFDSTASTSASVPVEVQVTNWDDVVEELSRSRYSRLLDKTNSI